MRIHSGTKLAGVLGWPLRQTLSPAIHNAAFHACNLDWIYLAFPVDPGDLPSAVAGMRALGLMGANVTMPHKQTIVELLDEVSGDAGALGAVNTVQRVGDRLVGHNTDVDGFREFLAGDAGVHVAGKRVLLLGAGGAARAVLRALDDLGAGEVAICARRAEQARALDPLVSRGVSVVGWGDAARTAEEVDVIVNTTPVGAAGERLLPGARLTPAHVVVDLIYYPPTTPLVERARSAGAQAWGGLGMLVRQGASSFRIWTGQDPPIETMSAAALRALRAAGHSRGA